MWHPTPAIRFPLLEGPCPSESEAASSRWFSPVRMGPVRLEQRTWVPAMVPWRASEEGFVTEEVLDWYGRFARGRPGAIVVEATGVRDVPSGPLLRIGHDRFGPGLERLVEVVRRASGGHTRLLIQVIDFLAIKRRPDPVQYFTRFLEITDRHRAHFPGQPDVRIREALLAMEDAALERVLAERELESLRQGHRERVTDTDLAHIRDLPKVLPEIFSSAALRAKKAGFDGVELHYAHAYTLASFLSVRNTRTDGYGGARENRVRLPLEVYRAVRSAVGSDFAVGCRFLSDEVIHPGNRVEDAISFGVEFARAGMDFLSLSRGGKFEDARQPEVGQAAYPYTGPSGWECMPTVLADERGPFGRNVEPSAAIRAAVRAAGFSTPVVVSGGIHDFAQAEGILNRGEADIVAAARQSLADPDWFLKLRQGRGAEVRRCEFTNYCEGLDQKHKQVTCKLWDRGRLDEPGVKLSADGKRRLIAPIWKAGVRDLPSPPPSLPPLLALPKAELHLHLFGAMPRPFFADQLRKIPPARALEGAPGRYRAFFWRHANIRALIASDRPEERLEDLFRFDSFGQFLGTYLFTSYFVKDPGDLRRLIDAVCRDLAAQGVVYAEITISLPEQIAQGISLEAALACMDEARRRSDVRISWIVDFVRDLGPAAALALSRRLAAEGRNVVAGVTIGGSEHKFPPALFADAYRIAREAGFRLTAHAGEAAGASSVRDAVEVLGCERIGHGVRAIEDPDLVALLAERKIALEVCPTSNIRTGVVPSYEAHPVRKLFESGVPVTLSTDDPTFFRTDLTGEYAHLSDMGFSDGELLEILRNGFRHAFLPRSEIDRFLTRVDRSVKEA